VQIISFNSKPHHSGDQSSIFHPFLIYSWQLEVPIRYLVVSECAGHHWKCQNLSL